MTHAPIDTVLAWHTALNAGNLELLLALSTDDVEVGGPRGAGRGSNLLGEWVARASIRLEPRRMFGRDDVVVVEQVARWRTDDGQLTDPQEVASVFRTQADRVASVIRYPDLASALAAAQLEDVEGVPSPC